MGSNFLSTIPGIGSLSVVRLSCSNRAVTVVRVTTCASPEPRTDECGRPKRERAANGLEMVLDRNVEHRTRTLDDITEHQYLSD